MADKLQELKKKIKKEPKNSKLYEEWRDAIAGLDTPDEGLEEYRQAIEKNLNTAEAYNDFGILLDDLKKYNKAIEQYKKAIEKRDDYADAYNGWGNALLILKKYEEATKQYEKAIEKKNDYLEAYYNWGLALYELGEYEKAIEKFKKTIEKSQDDAWSYHNWAYILYKQGLFRLSKEKLQYACSAYEKIKEDDLKTKNAANFFFHGSIYQYLIKDLEKAAEIYEEGLKLDPENRDILLNLVELYFEMKDDAIGDKEETRHLRNRYHWQATAHFRKAKSILEKKQGEKEDVTVLKDLGRLFLLIKDYPKSKEYLLKALEKDENDPGVVSNLGVVSMREERYKDAISYFKKTLTIDPDDLKMRSNLAEAYLKAEYKDKAETEYREILAITPFYMESLIGLGEVYTRMAEDAKKRNDAGYAEVMLSRALSFYSQALKLDHDKSEDASKALNKTELSALFYAKGYARAMLYETQSRRNDKLLKEAKADFNEVSPGTPNYHKARRAVERIEERLCPPHEITARWGSWLIGALSIIIFFLAQAAFFIKGVKPLETGYYALITFGALIFMVAGLFLRQLSKLKVGAIELEKSSLDQVTTSASLGIQK